MLFSLTLFTLLFSSSVFAAPATNLATIDAQLLRANETLPTNGSTSITYPINGTPLTLQITPLLGQNIARNDLVIALYDSREYVQLHIRNSGDGRLSGNDSPFSSTKIPSPPTANCVVKVESGTALKSMTYSFLGDTIQGLMDYTFYPYTANVNSLTFEVSHDIWGILGRGSLTAVQPQSATATS